MTKSVRISIAVVVMLVIIACFGQRAYQYLFFKLPPPTSPPSFGISYIYQFYSAGLLIDPTTEDEIKKDIKNIKDAGFEGIKINFAFRQNNQTSERIAEIAAKNGLYPIGQFVGHDQKPSNRAFTDGELAEWEKFVREETRLNKNIVYYWEIWNEPCMTELRFRYGTPAEYLELLRGTQEIIKEENPSAKIIVTADYGDAEAETFTKEFLALGGDKYLDYLSFHPYNAIDPKARYNLTETVAQEKELAKKYNRPLWITEIGAPDSDSGETRQAELALTLFQTAYENKIPIVWFYWSDRRVPSVDNKTGWGLVRKDNSFKPAYEKIKLFIGEARRQMQPRINF